MLMGVLSGSVGVALVGLGAGACSSPSPGLTPSPTPRPRAIPPRRVATGEFSVVTPGAGRDATCDTAHIGRLNRAGTVTPLLGHDALWERRGLNDLRARYQRTRGRGWSAGGWSNGVTTPRQEAPPC
jgi:hypothetical protein